MHNGLNFQRVSNMNYATNNLYGGTTDFNDSEEFYEEDSDDESMTVEDRALRQEILKNFIASNKLA